jgi:mono/diheme cytochrome c family protein
MIDFIKVGSKNGAKYGVQGQGSAAACPASATMLTDEQIKAIVEYVRSL